MLEKQRRKNVKTAGAADTVINALCFQRKKTRYPPSGEYPIVKHYVIYNSLYVDTLPEF